MVSIISCSLAELSVTTTSSIGATTTSTSWLSTSVSIQAITSPTRAISFSLKKCLIILPETGDGTSESTLSVATSTKISSTLTVSPTFFSHLIMVASATLSPIFGNISSY